MGYTVLRPSEESIILSPEILLNMQKIHVYNSTMMGLVLVLTIFNEGAYLTFKSIFHKALNLF